MSTKCHAELDSASQNHATLKQAQGDKINLTEH